MKILNQNSASWVTDLLNPFFSSQYTKNKTIAIRLSKLNCCQLRIFKPYSQKNKSLQSFSKPTGVFFLYFGPIRTFPLLSQIRSSKKTVSIRSCNNKMSCCNWYYTVFFLLFLTRLLWKHSVFGFIDIGEIHPNKKFLPFSFQLYNGEGSGDTRHFHREKQFPPVLPKWHSWILYICISLTITIMRRLLLYYQQ